MSLHRWLIWNLLFPAQEWAKGHPSLRILKDMEALDRCDPAELKTLQAARLRDFIDYTFSHVPHVRNIMQRAGLEPSQISRQPASTCSFPPGSSFTNRRSY